MLHDFFKNGKLLKEVNGTYIVLFPKIKNVEYLDQCRPISLCNFTYKVITKVLANKMKQVIQKMISLPQTAFMKDSNIGENIILA